MYHLRIKEGLRIGPICNSSPIIIVIKANFCCFAFEAALTAPIQSFMDFQVCVQDKWNLSIHVVHKNTIYRRVTPLWECGIPS